MADPVTRTVGAAPSESDAPGLPTASPLSSIALLDPSAQIGGAERVLIDVVASVRAVRPAINFLAVLSGDGPLAVELRELGVSVQTLPFPVSVAALGDSPTASDGSGSRALIRTALAAPDVFRYARSLRQLLHDFGPSVVHSNGAKMHLLSALACHGVAPIIWHLHDFIGSRPFMRVALKQLSARCSAIIANSESVAEDARLSIRGSMPTHTVLNAVNLDRFNPLGPTLDLDALAGVSPAAFGTVRVGLVATFAKWKGHETFFRSIAAIPRTIPVRAYVVGGPLYETRGSQFSLEELRHMVAQLGVSDRIAFTGHTEDVAAAMRALNVVVHASTQPEPFGLVIAEAMACGRPVVTSGTGGAREAAEGLPAWLTVRSADSDGIASAVTRLVSDADLRARLGATGRRIAEERFDRARLSRELIPVYERLARQYQS